MKLASSSMVVARGDPPASACARSGSLLGAAPLRGLPSLLRRRLRERIPPRAYRRRRANHRVLAISFLLTLASAILIPAAAARAQQPQGGPSIAQLERLLAEREGAIGQFEARLARLEATGDSLARAKRSASPGSAQYGRISNQIRENSVQIEPLQRDLRRLHEEAQDLKTELFQRYNTAVAETNQRIEELRRQGRTPQSSTEFRRLVDQLPRYLEARERYAAAVEEERCAPFQPDLVLLATDSPSQLRYKEALARDLVDQIDGCIEEIQKQINNVAQRQRIKEEAERLTRELEMWGDQGSRSTADELEAMLEGRGLGGARGIGNPFDDPRERIQILQRRRLELVERRQEYAAKAQLFAQRLREFYP